MKIEKKYFTIHISNYIAIREYQVFLVKSSNALLDTWRKKKFKSVVKVSFFISFYKFLLIFHLPNEINIVYSTFKLLVTYTKIESTAKKQILTVNICITYKNIVFSL